MKKTKNISLEIFSFSVFRGRSW